MKKIQKKLVLKKKTIAELNDQAINTKKMNKIQGGKTPQCITHTCRTYCPDGWGQHC